MSKCGGNPLRDGGALPAFATPERTFFIGLGPDALPSNAVDLPKADLSIIVVDGTTGLTQEARRHIAIANAVGSRHVVLAVDGLDDAGWDRSRFQRVAEEFVAFSAGFAFTSALAVPLSLAGGGNVVEPSPNTPWYKGLTLLAHLVRVPVDPQRGQRPLRLVVEREVQRDGAQSLLHCQILSGTLHRHGLVSAPLSGITAKINRILVNGSEREVANPGESVAVELDRTLHVGEGEILADPQHLPHVTEQFAAKLVWLGAEALLPGRDYLLRIGGREIVATATSLKYRLDTETMLQQPARTLQSGEIGALTLATAGQLALDAFTDLPQIGRFTLSDRYSQALIAAGTVDFVLRRGVNVHLQPLTVSKPTRTSLKGHGPCILWFTGLSGAGKSTIANLVEVQLARRGSHTYLLDGDNVRHGLNKNLGFTAADRVENIRRVGEVAKLFVDAGLIVLCSFISPFRAERAAVRSLVEPGEFVEIFVHAPLAVCEDRDPKGLYAKSRAGELPNFTGIDSPYEEPENPDLVLDTASTPAAELAHRVLALLEARELIAAEAHKID
jgi:bifunctional enzyme CysN/CysC